MIEAPLHAAVDAGDIIFLIIMGLGLLSSIGGKKKGKRPPARRRAPTPAAGDRDVAQVGQRRSRLQEARSRIAAQMEEMLRELDQQAKGGKPPAPPVPETPLPKRQSRLSHRARLEDPLAVTVEPPQPEPVERDPGAHEAFHEKYITALKEPGHHRSAARARRHLKHSSLREAMLLQEILRPPKALR